MRRGWVLGSIFVSLVAAGAPLAQSPTPRAPYQQSPAVLARFADVPIRLDAPGLAPGRTTFTSQSEMEAHLAGLKARAPRFLLGSLGASSQGRDLPYLMFTAEGFTDLGRVRRLRRPVVWLIGQQHGNEPAGGEAMLALASALADGELRPLLRRVTVVVVPRANPDGAAAFTRRTGQDFDLNRDHLLASLPETRAIQAKMVELAPDMVVDAHEYGASQPWLPRFGGLSPWDVTLLDATHPGVPARTTALARSVVQPAIEARLRAAGLSSGVYLAGSPGTGPQDHTVPTGGAAPGISRNYYGLTGAVSFLLETRGSDTGRAAFQRRVASHYVAASGALEAAAREGGRLRRGVAAARRELARTRDPLPVQHELSKTPYAVTLLDPETAAEKPVQLLLLDSRELRVTETRPRPQGYLLAPGTDAARKAFAIKGLPVCRVTGREPVVAEGFRVTRTGPITRATREGINPEAAVTVVVEPRTITPAGGWSYVPMAQPGSAVVAASLEPDSVGSHIGVGLIPVASDGTAPVFRLPVGARRPRLARGPGCG